MNQLNFCTGLCFLIALLTLKQSTAQTIERYNIPFKQDETNLAYPYVGGFSNPIFSNIDLNKDSLEDLYIFEYSDKTHHSFLQEEGEWKWVENQCTNFPEMESWVFLIDYNKDGASDIFTYSFKNEPGIVVYDGYWLDNKLAFKLHTFTENKYSQAVYQFENNYNYLYSTAGDLSAIADVDFDGDVDIVLKSRSMDYFNLYKNLSAENGFNSDSLIFVFEDDCWGKIYDNGSNGYVLSENPAECAGFYLKTNESKQHGNSTQSLLDYNNDQLIDLLVADGGGNNTSLFVNGGTMDKAYFIQQQNMYPLYNLPISLNYMPTIFQVDYNLDGYKDILVSPQLPISENKNAVLLYKNTGNRDSLTLQFTDDNLFNQEVLDFGTGSHPAVADVNGDGLLDLVIGNYGYFLPGGDRDARLIFCLNTGTKTQPAFEITDEDWLGLSHLSAWYFTPTFADIDGDKDKDLIFGSNNGNLFHMKNEASIGQAMEFNQLDSAWMEIHSLKHPLGQRTVPTFYDLNKDGLLDLIVGERNGTLNYFQNTGTATKPYFNPDLKNPVNNDFLGDINVSKTGSLIGNSAPYFVETKTGTKLLVTSKESGVLQYEVNFLKNEATFSLLSDTLLNYKLGYDLHTIAADLNNDSYLDLISGNLRGGLAFFTTPKTEEWQQDVMLSLNPSISTTPNYNLQLTNKQLKIWVENGTETITGINIFSVTGQTVYASSTKTNQLILNVESYPAGLYFGLLQIPNSYQYFKISVK